MDSTSETGGENSSSSIDLNSDSNAFKISGSNSLEDLNALNSNASQPIICNRYKNDSYIGDNRRYGLLELEEDHFSVHSEVDYLNDVEYSTLNRDEQLELTISKYRGQLESLAQSDLNENDRQEKKRQIVKKICDLKLKLVKLREEAEFDDAMKDGSQVDDLKQELSDDNPIFFKRIYSFSKSVAGHKLVLSNDIFENEKRLKSTWKNYAKNSSPMSLSPPTASSISSTSNDLLTNSLPISRLLNLLTSNHLSYLTTSCVNWTSSVFQQPTNPMQQLICDHCLRKSSKTLNDYIIDAFKFTRKDDHHYHSSSSPFSSSAQINEIRANNPYLVCIYCFFTIHYNCLTKTMRKCPKTFFDSMSNDDVMNEFYSRLYNYSSSTTNAKSNNIDRDDNSNRSTPVNGIIECYQKRMKRIILKICPEMGLSNQGFRCAECRIAISPSSPKQPVSKPKLCDYSGLYFCENCHMGDTAIIPARVIHNWDFQPQPVSRASLQIISYLKNKSFHYDRSVLINLVEINPMLYGLVDELIQIKRLRTELCHIYKYIWLCKQPGKPRQWISIMCQLGSHLLNEKEINYLSFCDICDLRSLVKNLSELEYLFINHITTCEGCRGKGFYCELCPNKEDILFPFSPNTTICPICNAVYHKNCYFRRNRLCPRCNRIKDKTNIRLDPETIEELRQDEEEQPQKPRQSTLSDEEN